RKKLYLLYAKNRTVFGNSGFRVMSRFVDEIPREYVEEKRADYFTRRRNALDRPGLIPAAPAQTDDWAQVTDYPDDWYQTGAEDESESEFRQGARVLHPLLGEGVIRRSIGRDKLIVEFAGRGMKKISLRFTQLKVL